MLPFQAIFGYTLVGKFPDLMNYIEKIRRVDKKHLDQLSTMASIPKATRLKDEKTERLRDSFWDRFTLEQGDFDDQHHPKETNFRVYLENRYALLFECDILTEHTAVEV